MTLYLQVSSNGRIIIPKQIRDELGLTVGSKVVATIDDNTLQITSWANSIKKAQGLVKKYCANDESLVESLFKERREEIRREEVKYLALPKIL